MLSIAVADDEFEAREGLVDQLNRYPEEWTVAGTAKNGKEALELVLRCEPDILIADISMPVYSGIDVMRKLKEWETGTIVILLTGYAEFEYAREAVTLGAFAYLLKPAPHREIADTIRRARDERRINARGEKTSEGTFPPDIRFQCREPVRYVLEQIHSRYHLHLSLKEIAERQGMNPDYLSTLFREEVGATFSDYLTAFRIGRAKRLLKELDLKVYEASTKVGYRDYKHFTKLFKQWTGISPLDYKKS